MTLERLLDKAELAYRDCGRYVLSVFCRTLLENESIDEMLFALCAEAPAGGKNVWLSSVQRLNEAGFRLLHEPPPDCHYDVDLGAELTVSVVERFVAAFHAPRRNPAWSTQ